MLQVGQFQALVSAQLDKGLVPADAKDQGLVAVDRGQALVLGLDQRIGDFQQFVAGAQRRCRVIEDVPLVGFGVGLTGARAVEFRNGQLEAAELVFRPVFPHIGGFRALELCQVLFRVRRVLLLAAVFVERQPIGLFVVMRGQEGSNIARPGVERGLEAGFGARGVEVRTGAALALLAFCFADDMKVVVLRRGLVATEFKDLLLLAGSDGEFGQIAVESVGLKRLRVANLCKASRQAKIGAVARGEALGQRRAVVVEPFGVDDNAVVTLQARAF